MDGQRGVLMSVFKTGGSSTLDIVARLYALLPRLKAVLPPALVITPLFDQSIFVRAAVQGVIREALIAAVLTALMILLFLGNWRSTLIIAISIPLSILVSICVLSALGETINIMTLGGLALAVGILVDDATVEIENINRNLAQGKETVRAILDGAQQIAVPAFVSTLCICIVFVPMFFLTGVAKFLFVPLAEAVVFAMLASYCFHERSCPPWRCICFADTTAKNTPPARSLLPRSARIRERFRAYAAALPFRASFLPGSRLDVHLHVPVALLCIRAHRPGSRRGFLSGVDAGLIRLHMRGRVGERIEETARECDQCG